MPQETVRRHPGGESEEHYAFWESVQFHLGERGQGEHDQCLEYQYGRQNTAWGEGQENEGTHQELTLQDTRSPMPPR